MASWSRVIQISPLPSGPSTRLATSASYEWGKMNVSLVPESMNLVISSGSICRNVRGAPIEIGKIQHKNSILFRSKISRTCHCLKRCSSSQSGSQGSGMGINIDKNQAFLEASGSWTAGLSRTLISLKHKVQRNLSGSSFVGLERVWHIRLTGCFKMSATKLKTVNWRYSMLRFLFDVIGRMFLIHTVKRLAL